MTYEKVTYGTDPESIAARERATTKSLTKPATRNWITALEERQAAGEILMPVQLDPLRKARGE